MGMIEEFKRKAIRQFQGTNHLMQVHEPAMIYALVDLDQLYFIFIVGAIGLCLGCVIFVGEMLSAVKLRRMVFGIRELSMYNNLWFLNLSRFKKVK